MSEELTMNYNSYNEIRPKQQILVHMAFLSQAMMNLSLSRLEIDKITPIKTSIYLINNMLLMDYNPPKKQDITNPKLFYNWVLTEHRKIINTLNKKRVWLENIESDIID